MLFNSFAFIYGFLPLALAGYYLLGRTSRNAALNWLSFASLIFYAWWRPLNVLLIGPSVLINFLLARLLVRIAASNDRPRLARLVLLGGIAFNIAFLGYFKYKNFFSGTINDVFGTDLVLTQVILPLGISFITFQKIAFLVDVYGKRIQSFSFRDYALFVLFFPQLIAGPIVHFREMMPQFQHSSLRPDGSNFAVGITLFVFGLFKKVVLADSIAPFVSLLYEHANGGQELTLLPAWLAALGFTVQIYFDFSGYSDMALGVARLFGVRLPANFDSPLKATSIIDYWLRWHITLSRFLTAYIYNPIVLSCTRRLLARGLPIRGGANTTIGTFLTLLVVPTLLTMTISGLWHGASYMFVVWGLMHGVLLSVNHAWRIVVPRFWNDRRAYQRVMRPIGFVLTFLSVVVAMVFFRAPTMPAAGRILQGMIGGNGFGLPEWTFHRLGSLGNWLLAQGAGVDTWWTSYEMSRTTVGVAVLLTIALILPNTLRLLARFEPALGVKADPLAKPWLQRLQWSASLGWALTTAAVAAIGIARVGGPSEFLYWQF